MMNSWFSLLSFQVLYDFKKIDRIHHFFNESRQVNKSEFFDEEEIIQFVEITKAIFDKLL